MFNGKKWSFSDLTDEDIKEIRKLKEVDGLFYSEIVEIFAKRGKHIRKNGVKSICQRRTWRDVA